MTKSIQKHVQIETERVNVESFLQLLCVNTDREFGLIPIALVSYASALNKVGCI